MWPAAHSLPTLAYCRPFPETKIPGEIAFEVESYQAKKLRRNLDFSQLCPNKVKKQAYTNS